MWDHTFNKNFGMSFGIISPTKEYGTNPNMSHGGRLQLKQVSVLRRRSLLHQRCLRKDRPMADALQLERILWLGSPGIPRGNDKLELPGTATGRVGTVVNNPDDYDDKLSAWGAAFKGYIPIIPEKKGNKGRSTLTVRYGLHAPEPIMVRVTGSRCI